MQFCEIVFMYTENRSGPIIDPCGTPVLKLRALDLETFETVFQA